MFSVTTVATGELFVLPEARKTIDEWRGPVSRPLMMGSVRTAEAVMPVIASLGVGIDGEHLLCLAFGSTDVHYVGELRVCAYAKDVSGPEYSGWLSLLPMFRDEPPSDEAAMAAGELRLRGQRTRNADGSMRIMLSVGPAREDQDRLRGWVPV
ncbi:hypothetical protein [Paraburkholderia diazotrophica]|uniref:Uncharacterized protein n=1 Tax=Paraburkholderia diazotrophica TaxID=667676 RepID=A0A1H7EIU8_9BURK|nr:hypothetical protein [Paraburkholderia diazotrophica]SEK13801.1 hypothetical protein SAMN05192539_107611 [Paraburkholderia diazotrophica]